MKQYIKHLFKTFFEKLGLEVKYYIPYDESHQSLMLLCKNLKIDTALDIGANEGQFAESLRKSGYDGKIISIEPINKQNDILKKKSINDANWSVLEPLAIGSVAGKSVINISKNSVSSSLLDMLPLHINNAPDSLYIESQEVEVKTIDEILQRVLDGNKPIAIKLDVQGLEWDILDSSKIIWQNDNILYLEVSFQKLYKDQKTYHDIMSLMTKHNYEIHSIHEGMRNSETGGTLQADIIFRKVKHE